MKSLVFIEEHKEMFFHWLFQVHPTVFPRVCEFASDVLGCWIYLQFPEDNIMVQSGLYDGWGHAWIEVDGTIVDFTITQFLGGMKQNERTDLNDQEFYQTYFQTYLSSPFITKRKLTKNYRVEEGLFICQYDLARYHQKKGSTFETYLQEVANVERKRKIANV